MAFTVAPENEVRHAELRKGTLFLEDGRRVKIVNWVLQCDARELSGVRVSHLFRKRKLVRGPFNEAPGDNGPGITKRTKGTQALRSPVMPPPDLPVYKHPGAERPEVKPAEPAPEPGPAGGADDGPGGEETAVEDVNPAAVSLAADLQSHTVKDLQEMAKGLGLPVSQYRNKSELIAAVVEKTLADASTEG